MEFYLSQIFLMGANFNPRGSATCEGQLLAISSNTALFSLIGTTFGGDGRTSFGLPDLRGRVAVGRGNGPGLSDVRWGERGGVQNSFLTIPQMPSHTHTVNNNPVEVSTSAGGESSPNGTYLAAHVGGFSEEPTAGALLGGQVAGSTTSSPTGSSQSHNNMQPYLGLYYCIATTGIFPSRN